jgi:predicted transcriptional regulator
MAEPKAILFVRLPVDLNTRLEDYCRTTRQQKVAVAVAALEEYLSAREGKKEKDDI